MKEFVKSNQQQNANAEAPLTVQPDSIPANSNEDDGFNADAFAERVLKDKIVFRAKNDGGQYVSFFNKKGCRETLRLDSDELTDFLIDQFHQETNKSILSSKFSAVLQRLKARAKRGGAFYSIHSRIAMQGDSLFYNLGNESGDIVHVDRTGWRIVSGSKLPKEIMFKKTELAAPQVLPVRTEKTIADLLQPFIHLGGKDFQLFVIALLSLFLEEIAKPVISLDGIGGSGKTTIAKLIQELVDPVRDNLTSTLPENSRDVQAFLGALYLAKYDNADTIRGNISNILCNSVTGGAVVARRLYTNGGVYAQSFRNAIVLNGVNISELRPDFASRVVAFELRRFGDEGDKRLAETQLWLKFEALRGELLGAIFNTLAAAYATEPYQNIPPEFRMTDFFDWGSRFSLNLYGDAELFQLLYSANRLAVNSKMVEDDPLCAAFIEYASIPDHRDRETETSGELYRKFKKFAEKNALFNVKQRAFPQDASAFSKKLKVMAPVLEANGIGVETHRTNAGRYKTIRLLGNG